MALFFAVIQRDGHLIPILKGGDGPDAECLQTWESEVTAYEEAGEVLLAHAYPHLIFNLEDGR